MPNTGFLDPVSAFSVSAGAGGTRAWTSAGSTGSLFSAARLSDNVRVLVNDLSSSVIPFPFFARFSAALPANADVQGFTVRYERRRNASAVSANETWIRLVSGAGAGLQLLGTTANANVANLTATDAYFTAGGSGSMFGVTTADASAGRVNTLGFGVNIRYGTATTITSAIAQIDHMQLQVHYSVPSVAVSGEPFSAEFDYEAGSLVFSKNIGSNAAEFENEHFSPTLTGTHNVAAANAETDYESLSGVFSQNLVAQSTEFDEEYSVAAVSKNLIGLNFEGDYEAQSVGFLDGVLVVGPEFGHETAEGMLTKNVLGGAIELDSEFSSAAISRVIVGTNAEFDYEAGLAGLSNNVLLPAAEFDGEWANAALTLSSSMGAAFCEFGAEWAAVGLTLSGSIDVGVFSAEFGRSVVVTYIPPPWRRRANPRSLSWRRRLRAMRRLA